VYLTSKGWYDPLYYNKDYLGRSKSRRGIIKCLLVFRLVRFNVVEGCILVKIRFWVLREIRLLCEAK